MLLRAYSVFDSKAKAFIPPFFLQNDAMAVREFTNAVNDPGHKFHVNAEDYSLHSVAGFDDETGMIKAGMHPVLLVTALQVKRVEPGDLVPIREVA